MTKGIHVMHSEAERKAIGIGPRITSSNNVDSPVAGYYLTKKELRDLFARNGFNTNGVSWLKMIIGWKDIWEELAPSPTRILDKNDNSWQVCFIHLNHSDYTSLKMFCEKNDARILAVEP